MEFTKEQIAAAEQCKTADELLALAKEAGFDITEEQAEVFFAATRKGELSDGELDSVAGGALKKNSSLYSTVPPHRLIVTLFNHCALFQKSTNGSARTCSNCQYLYHNSKDSVMAFYCNKRFYFQDPLNP